MSIQYLNTSTQMKIRPVSDEDVLFEMETNEFVTTCCRVDTSYDLVVRDITSGAMLFCISGAEIEDHPLDVYISDNHHIGRIKGMNIYVHGQNTQTVRIQRNETQYTIQRSTVTTTAGLVTLNWPTNLSVELKALSIAFALNIAMTKRKGTVIDGGNISTPILQVKRESPALLPSTEKEACPKRNRCIIPSIFASSNVKQEFWLKAAGWNKNDQTAFGVLMNKWNTQVVLYIGSKHGKTSNGGIIKALHPDGEEEYTGTWIFAGRLTSCSVNYHGQEIGKFTFDGQTGKFTISCSEENTITEIFTRSCRRTGSNAIYKSFVDENNRQYGTINDYVPETLDIDLAAGVSSLVKKIIICASSYYYSSWKKSFKDLPRLRLSKLICNCYYCQKPLICDQHYFPTNGCLFKKENFLLKPLGHNTSRNITYFISCTVMGGFLDWTLEVTPIQNFKGVAKIEGRSFAGELIFTSIIYQQHDLIAIYNWNNELVAYIENDKIRDREQNVIFVISQSVKSKVFEETRFGPNVQFFAIGSHRNTKFVVSTRHAAMSIYRFYFHERKPSVLQVIIECTLSLKLHSDVYGLDKIPTPEIVYCYRRARNMRIDGICF